MPASTVAEYLAALPADRHAVISAVRKTINDNLPDGYEEGIQFGIGRYVPLSLYPEGYGENRKVPLPLVALASQKSGMVLHFLCFYGHPTLSTWFVIEYKKTGKKLDMGKGCVRFKKLDDLALDVVGRTVARVPREEHIANYRAARALLRKGNSAVRRVKERPGSQRVRERGRPHPGFAVSDNSAPRNSISRTPGIRSLVPLGQPAGPFEYRFRSSPLSAS
jgi:hypothetical protein